MQLDELYTKKIKSSLRQELELKNVMQVPTVEKITLNMGVGEAVSNKKVLDQLIVNFESIAGQKPIITLAKKSISGFKIREGWPLGLKVTLRRQKMYDFMERLVWVSLPKVRDFRGLNPKFDGRGNYSFGIREYTIFPEIKFENVDQVWGMDVCVTTSAESDKHAYALLKAFGFPFHKEFKE
jgi:large subunit ribosomal protein L5